MSQSDEGLTAELATDLDRHFKQLVLTYQHQLYTFLLRQTGNAEDAEDIAQESFIRAYYALKNYQIRQVCQLKLRPWLLKIALNVFYNRLRRHTLSHVPIDTSEESTLLELEDQAITPDEEVWKRERRHELEQLVASLPERYRVVINLYYFEDLSYQEIADLLDQPMGTIKAKLHRGIGLLRKVVSTAETDQVR
jgi:RNA polymerase sigma-70 factor (ECF subfamily)